MTNSTIINFNIEELIAGIQSETSSSRADLLSSLVKLENDTNFDSYITRFLECLAGVTKDSDQPVLGVQYEEANAEDFSRAQVLFRDDIAKVFDLSVEEKFDVTLAMNSLSESRRKLLEAVNSALEIFSPNNKGIKDGNDLSVVDTNLKGDISGEVPSSASKAGLKAEEGKNEVSKRGRKRKPPTSSADETSTLTKDGIASAEKQSASSSTTEGNILFQGIPLSEEFSPSKQPRRSSIHVTHYKGSDILMTLLADIGAIKQEISTVDTLLSTLFCTKAEQPSNNEDVSSLLRVLWNRADVAHSAEDSPPDFESIHQISRTILKISHEYLRVYQHGLDTFDTQRAAFARESIDRYRRRWELLNTFNIHRGNGRLQLSDIPTACDRIPNPFGNFAGDYSNWAWLRDIYPTTKLISDDEECQKGEENVSSASAIVEFVSCEVKELQDIAARLLDTIFLGVADRPLSFFETVRRCAALLAQGLNCIVVDKYESILSTDGGQHQQQTHRVEAATHRALLIGTILSVFNGGIRPHVNTQSNQQISTIAPHRKELNHFIDKLRGTFNHSFSASAAGSVNNGGNHGVHGMDRAWGPILLVTKISDMDAWEAGCREIFRDFQLDIMPYYGSDSDRIACRAYLRSFSSAVTGTTSGLNSVGSGLYCDRSHCHVIIVNYETLFLDVHYFKDISWFAVVFDEPWGFVSSEMFTFAKNQVFTCLKTRHRILSCSSLSSLHPSNNSTDANHASSGSTTLSKQHGEDDENMDVEDTETADNNNNSNTNHNTNTSASKGAVYQMPDMMAVVTLLCPFAVGLGFHHDPEQVFCTHHLQHIPNQQFFPASTSYNNYKQRKPTGLPIRDAQSIEWVEIDGASTYCMTRLLASITAVCSNAMIPYSKISELITQPLLFDAFFQVYEQLQRIVPLLAWYGSDIQLVQGTPQTKVSAASQGHSLATYHMLLQSTNSGSSTNQLDMLVTVKNAAYNIMYHDAELLEETQFINLKSVGLTGTAIQRILIPETLKITESGEEIREFVYDKPKGISGRPRGKSRPRKNPSSSAATANGEGDNTEETNTKNAADVNGAEEGADDGEEEALATNAVVGSAPPKKRARKNKSTVTNEGVVAAEVGSPSNVVQKLTSPIMDQDEDGADNVTTKQEKEDDPQQQNSSSTPAKDSSHQTEMAVVTTTAAATGATGAAAGPAATLFEEEMARGITRRAGFYFVNLLQNARIRFLGVFASEAEAQAVFTTAYQCRELENNSTHTNAIANNNNSMVNAVGGSMITTNNNVQQSPSTNIVVASATNNSNSSKFKGRLGRDMKLSDGSFISEEYHRQLSEEDMYQDIRHIQKPLRVVDRHSTDWNNIYHDPPSYGLFQAVESLPNNDTDAVSFVVPAKTLILGQAEPKVLHSLFTQHLEESLEQAVGFIFDYQPPKQVYAMQNPSTTENSSRHSDSVLFSEEKVPVLHLAHDESIAKYHALIAYNGSIQQFEIIALHPHASVYVDGVRVLYHHSGSNHHDSSSNNSAMAYPLSSKSIVQLGNRSFIFCLPRPMFPLELLSDSTANNSNSANTALISSGNSSSNNASAGKNGAFFRVDTMKLRVRISQLLQETRQQWRRGQLPSVQHLLSTVPYNNNTPDEFAAPAAEGHNHNNNNSSAAAVQQGGEYWLPAEVQQHVVAVAAAEDEQQSGNSDAWATAMAAMNHYSSNNNAAVDEDAWILRAMENAEYRAIKEFLYFHAGTMTNNTAAAGTGAGTGAAAVAAGAAVNDTSVINPVMATPSK